MKQVLTTRAPVKKWLLPFSFLLSGGNSLVRWGLSLVPLLILLVVLFGEASPFC